MPSALRGRATRTDFSAGSRLKARRRALGLSQKALGLAIGVSRQQLQKYENGKDRISASRLQRLATVLNVEVSYFFEQVQSKIAMDAQLRAYTHIQDFLSLPEARLLVCSFHRIKSSALRVQIARLVEGLAKS